MAVKILVGIVVLIAGFLGFASTKPANFRYERSGIIQAPADKIYPFLSDFNLGSQWNPYEEKDLNMTKTYSPEQGKVGSSMDWSGNKDVGAGNLQIINLVPNESVDIKLTMTEPMTMSHMVHYKLEPVGEGTKFTWWQEGQNGLFGKVMTVVIDCETMFGEDMEKGIAKLKTVVEVK
ncbi:MAG: hypothetical protein EOP04_00880 [Proteobacteria bacterium]|nr:MAG: hypothetical protein EOP04_00880 [Pseudomonadota bacterium]